MKKSTIKKSVVKKPIKAQSGTPSRSKMIKAPVYKSPFGEKTPDSTSYFNAKAADYRKAAENMEKISGPFPKQSKGWGVREIQKNITPAQYKAKGYREKEEQALRDMKRQSKKGQPGYDKYGRIMKKGGKLKKK